MTGKRTAKSPRQRAEEALGVARRKVAKTQQRLRKARNEVTATERELAAAQQRLEYVAADPALPQDDAPELPDPEEGEQA